MQLVQPIGLTMSAKDGVTANLPSDREYAGTPFEGVFFSETPTMAEQAHPRATNAEDESDPAVKTANVDADRTDSPEDLDALAENLPKDAIGASEPATLELAETPPLRQPTVDRTDQQAGTGPDATANTEEQDVASTAKPVNPDERHRRASPISAMVEGLSVNTAQGSGAQSVPFVDDGGTAQMNRPNLLESDVRLAPFAKDGGGQSHTSAPTEMQHTTLAVLQNKAVGKPDAFVSKENTTVMDQEKPLQTSLSPSKQMPIGPINPDGDMMPSAGGPPLSSAFRHAASENTLLADKAMERTGPPDLSLLNARYSASASTLVAATLPANEGQVAPQTTFSFLPPRSREPLALDSRAVVHSDAAAQREMTQTPMQVPPTGTAHSPALTTDAVQDPLAKGISTFAELDLPPDSDLPIWDVRPTATASHGALTLSQLQRAEMPPHIANAIAEAFRKSPDKPIELALNPAELGRVRMVMTPQDTGIVVTITAERGDTLDLMRRNIDDLGRSLNDLGFADVSFEFSQDQNASANPDETMPDERSADLDSPQGQQGSTLEPTRHAITQTTATTGIDMRL